MILKREENWKRLQICCLDSVTEAGLELPYEEAKEMLLVDNVENKEFLRNLLEAKYEELSAPKKKSEL